MIVAIVTIVIVFLLSYFLMRGNSCKPCITPDVTTEPYSLLTKNLSIDQYNKASLVVRPTCNRSLDGSWGVSGSDSEFAAKFIYRETEGLTKNHATINYTYTDSDSQITSVVLNGNDISNKDVYIGSFYQSRNLLTHLNNIRGGRNNGGLKGVDDFLKKMKHVVNAKIYENFADNCWMKAADTSYGSNIIEKGQYLVWSINGSSYGNYGLIKV